MGCQIKGKVIRFQAIYSFNVKYYATKEAKTRTLEKKRAIENRNQSYVKY